MSSNKKDKDANRSSTDFPSNYKKKLRKIKEKFPDIEENKLKHVIVQFEGNLEKCTEYLNAGLILDNFFVFMP